MAHPTIIDVISRSGAMAKKGWIKKGEGKRPTAAGKKEPKQRKTMRDIYKKD